MKRNRNIFSYCLQSFVFPLCLLYYYCHYCHTNLSRRPNHSLMCKQFKLGKELKLVCNTIGGIQTEQLQLQVQLLSNSHIKEQPSIHCHQFNQNQATFATAVGVQPLSIAINSDTSAVFVFWCHTQLLLMSHLQMDPFRVNI